jgi:two-component system NtrC family sensor kinase
VLHNVGNALNSVKVGVDLVAASIRDSHLPSLRRAVDLLVTHRQNLARFLTNDERGRLLPLYLIEVADFLLAERERMSSEINAVKKHLEHIDSVVTLHQNSSLCTA